MPLHEDDPQRAGNLTDDEYRAAAVALRDAHGEAGLHTVPADIMSAAAEAAELRSR